MTGLSYAGLVLLATIAGLDLVSVLQGLIARPIVIGTVSGLLLSDLETGLRVGAALELFALDVVPVGAARYPDFGAATVAAVTYAAGSPWPLALGPAVGLGLSFAALGGATIPLVRRRNARVVRAYAARLAQGDARAVEAVHLAGLGHDAARSLALGFLATALGAGLGALGVIPDLTLGSWLAAIAVGGGVWAAAHGATVSGRTGARGRWALGGVAVGLLGVLA
jgi:PTS system mannose-specific IIC component